MNSGTEGTDTTPDNEFRFPPIDTSNVDDSEHVVHWAFWQCRECMYSGRAFRMDLLSGMTSETFEAFKERFPMAVQDHDWDLKHTDYTGHKSFYRWTLERTRSQVHDM